jgi:hypothetical protein
VRWRQQRTGAKSPQAGALGPQTRSQTVRSAAKLSERLEHRCHDRHLPDRSWSERRRARFKGRPSRFRVMPS